MASPWQKFCPEWNPAKGEEVVLVRREGKRDKILLGPRSSPHRNTCPPFHLGLLLLTSPIQSPQVAEAISHLNDHSIPAMLQLRWLWIRKTVSFPLQHYWNPPFSILKSFHVKDRFFGFFPHYCFDTSLFEISLFPLLCLKPCPYWNSVKFRDAWRDLPLNFSSVLGTTRGSGAL